MGIADPTPMLAILRSRRPLDEPIRYLDGPFDPKPHSPPRQSRFSDGSFPIYYSALEANTTRAEMRHHASLRFLGVSSIPGMAVFFREVRCAFEGQVKDLRPALGDIPHLIGEQADGAYDTCNAIAEEAKAVPLDGLVTQSARQPLGTCVPVFVRGSLSNPALGVWVTFSYNAADGQVACVEVP